MLTRILNSPEIGPTLGRAGVGAVAGGLFGSKVTPELFGYEGNPAATNAATILDAIMGGTMAGMGPAGIKAWAKQQGPMFGPQLGGSLIGAELAPIGMNLLTQGTQAAKAVADKPTGQKQLESMMKLPETRGAGIGAALAALGAIGTGSLRPKRESERIHRTGRLGMIKNDLMLYVVPAMLAGGLVGHGTRD
jgi:hypothetical protein